MASDQIDTNYSWDDADTGLSLVATPDKLRFSLYLLVAFIVSLILRPWDFLPALAPLRPVTLAIVSLTLVMLASGIKLEYLKLPLARTLGVLWLTMMATTVTSYWYGQSLEFAVKWFQLLLLFSFIGTLVISTDSLFLLTRWMTIVGGALGILAIKSKLSGNYAVDGRIVGVGSGFLSDPNELAQGLVAVLPFSWWMFIRGEKRLHRLIGIVCGTLMLVGIVLTESRGGLLSLITMTFILLILSRAPLVKRLCVVAVLGTAGLAMMPDSVYERYSTISSAAQTDQSAQTRLTVWKAGGRMFIDHFATGTGVTTFELVYGSKYIDRQVAGANWYAAHNSIVEVAAELGIVGVSAWLWFMLVPFLRLYRSRTALLTTMDDEVSPTTERLTSWTEAMIAALGAFFVGAMFLSKAFDIPVVMFVAIAVAGSELAFRWAEATEESLYNGELIDR